MSTILLVEDKPDNQIIIEDIFEFEEIDAALVIVGSAEEAMEQLVTLDPLLILMDLGLPGMQGLDATRVIKADPNRCHVPIWALTAHAMKEIRDEAIEAGCADYVTKPIDSASLARRLHDFVAAQSTPEGA